MAGSRARRFRSVQLPLERRWNADDARSVLTQLDASGLAVAEFATREGLDPQRLYRWRAQLRGGRPAFVEIARAATAASTIEVVLRSGQVVRVADGFGEETLRRLVQVLEDGSRC